MLNCHVIKNILLMNYFRRSIRLTLLTNQTTILLLWITSSLIMDWRKIYVSQPLGDGWLTSDSNMTNGKKHISQIDMSVRRIDNIRQKIWQIFQRWIKFSPLGPVIRRRRQKLELGNNVLENIFCKYDDEDRKREYHSYVYSFENFENYQLTLSVWWFD